MSDEQSRSRHGHDGDEDDDATHIASPSAADVDEGNAWTTVAVDTVVVMMAAEPAVVVTTEPAVMASAVPAAVV
ncbi:hypothetical protein [Actinoallomurus sp. CA-150999]|uniref:hypothetical protein n=1 Tax=Actinoallomurus sp. CA-150999 TaxID=3239887 RepID=UPI003D948EAB